MDDFGKHFQTWLPFVFAFVFARALYQVVAALRARTRTGLHKFHWSSGLMFAGRSVPWRVLLLCGIVGLFSGAVPLAMLAADALRPEPTFHPPDGWKRYADLSPEEMEDAGLSPTTPLPGSLSYVLLTDEGAHLFEAKPTGARCEITIPNLRATRRFDMGRFQGAMLVTSADDRLVIIGGVEAGYYEYTLSDAHGSDMRFRGYVLPAGGTCGSIAYAAPAPGFERHLPAVESAVAATEGLADPLYRPKWMWLFLMLMIPEAILLKRLSSVG